MSTFHYQGDDAVDFHFIRFFKQVTQTREAKPRKLGRMLQSSDMDRTSTWKASLNCHCELCWQDRMIFENWNTISEQYFNAF